MVSCCEQSERLWECILVSLRTIEAGQKVHILQAAATTTTTTTIEK
jgi:hypothetical protein